MKLLAMASSIVTSTYALIVIIMTKSKNSIHPDPRALPLKTISKPPRDLRPMMTRRVDDNPNLFFRVETQSPLEEVAQADPEHAGINSKSIEFFQMVKTTTTMNLLTLIFTVCYVPTVIHGIVNYNCKLSNGECDNYLRQFWLFRALHFVCIIVQSLVVLKRLV